MADGSDFVHAAYTKYVAYMTRMRQKTDRQKIVYTGKANGENVAKGEKHVKITVHKTIP